MADRITNQQRETIVRRAVAERDALLTSSIHGAPISAYSPEDLAFFRFWYGHILNDLMQPPLTTVDHATARYIWDAAQTGVAHPQALLELLKHCTPDYGWHDKLRSMVAALEKGAALYASPSTTRQQEAGSAAALSDGIPDAEAAMAYALKRWGYRQGTKECIAFYRGACWCVLAAPPSTPENAGGVPDGVIASSTEQKGGA